MNKRLVVGIAFILTGALGIWFISGAGYGSRSRRGGSMGFGMMEWAGGAPWTPVKTDFSSNGERIYYTGISEKTGPIPFRGGPMWLWFHGGSCVDCHGVDGRGGVPVMMGTKVPTDIRYAALTEKEGHGHEGEADHPVYTEQLIGKAIREGLNPAGTDLDWTMPRWQMTEEDSRDVVAYLKGLGSGSN